MSRLYAVLVFLCLFSSPVFPRSVTLVGPNSIPEPNSIITVDVYSDTPLFIMDLIASLDGNGEMVGAISSADGNDFGWDESGWPCDPYIDPNDPSWINCSGVIWAGTAVGHVGYFKFRYYGGQVTVNVPEYYLYDANCVAVPLANNTLVFGEPDPNQSLLIQQQNNFSNSRMTSENLSFITEQVESAVSVRPARQKQLLVCPNNSTVVNSQVWAASSSASAIALAGAAPVNSVLLKPKDVLSIQAGLHVDSLSESNTVQTNGLESLGASFIVDVNSDVTTNQLWTADTIYYVTADVNVKALLVIEPGTEVKFSCDGSMRVNNGGTLISKGLPYNMVYFTSDSEQIEWGYYDNAIVVEETASPATTICYTAIDSAVEAIRLENIRLDHPIENCFIVSNPYAVVETGPQLTDVKNNLFVENMYVIHVSFEDANGVADANSNIAVENNTSDWSDYGIVLHGSADANNAGFAFVANNIITHAYEAAMNVIEPNDAVYAIFQDNGYWENVANKNWNFPEYNPVEVNETPFSPRQDENFYFGHELHSGCAMIDAAEGFITQYPGLIGQYAETSGTPDSNHVDLGYHFPAWYTWNAGRGEYIPGDINQDRIIDYCDIAKFTQFWLLDQSSDPNFARANANGDSIVNMVDLANVAANWQKEGGPNPANIIPVFNANVSGMSGVVKSTLTVSDRGVHRVFLLVDGEIAGEYNSFERGGTVYLKTNEFRNGQHKAKVVLCYFDKVVTSSPIDINISNELSCISQPKGFEPGKRYYLYALGDAPYSVEIKNLVNDTVTYSGQSQAGLQYVIEPNAFPEQHGVYDLRIEKQGQQMMLLGSGSSGDAAISGVISRKFNKGDYNDSSNVYMLVSIGSEDMEESKERCWKAVIKSAVYKQIWPVFLRYNDCTWENLKFCLDLNNVKIWYHLSEGDYKVLLQPERSYIETKDGKVFSYLAKDFATLPNDYKRLSWYYENNHSVRELGFANNPKLNWVQFNSSFSSRTQEFTDELGIIKPGDPLGSRVFIGWKDKVLSETLEQVDDYNTYEERLWAYLKADNNLDFSHREAVKNLGTEFTISANFKCYGVLTLAYVYFDWPNIN